MDTATMFNPSRGKQHDKQKVFRQRFDQATDKQVDSEEVKTKVLEDIRFLRGRIAKIKHSKFSSSDPNILNTYESMLASREAVLAWLEENAKSKRD